jgi:hypothetical protein
MGKMTTLCIFPCIIVQGYVPLKFYLVQVRFRVSDSSNAQVLEDAFH